MSVKITIITGVAGTTGSAILDLLSQTEEVKSGNRIIIGYDNFFRGTEENIANHLGKSYFHFKQRKYQSIPDDFRIFSQVPVDEIYHMAAVVPTRYFYTSPDLTFEENCKGTIDLAYWAQLAEVRRFVVGSTSEVYGHIDDEDLPAVEFTASHFDSVESSSRWSYAEGKLLTEHVLNKVAPPMRVNHMRFANTYGVRDMDDNHVVPYLIKRVISNQDVHINKRADEFKRTFLNNKDAAIACVSVMGRGSTSTAYNVGSEQEVSILQLLDLIIQRATKKIQGLQYTGQVIRDIVRPGDPMRRILSTDRLYRDTGFTPQISLEQGIDEMIDEVINQKIKEI